MKVALEININDQEYLRVTKRYESVSVLFSKGTGRPILAHLRPSVQYMGGFKANCHHHIRGENLYLVHIL